MTLFGTTFIKYAQGQKIVKLLLSMHDNIKG